jgi:hypothetical protein
MVLSIKAIKLMEFEAMLPTLNALNQHQQNVATEKREERKRLEAKKRIEMLTQRLAEVVAAGGSVSVSANQSKESVNSVVVRGRKKAVEPATVEEIEAEIKLLQEQLRDVVIDQAQ